MMHDGLIEKLSEEIQKSEKRKGYFFLFVIFGGGFFFAYIVTVSLALIFRDFPLPFWAEIFAGIFGLMVLPAFGIIAILLFLEKKSQRLKEFIEKTKSILYRYEYWEMTDDDIDTILMQTKEIHKTLQFVYTFYKKNKNAFGDELYIFIKDFESKTLQALYEIRNNLEKEVSVKKGIVLKTGETLDRISTSPQWKSATHLQKERLQGQIKQFEELEKVLVRI